MRSAEAKKQYTDRKRAQALAYLGGKCSVCGVSESLEFDHIDRATKVYVISRNFNRRWAVLVQELDKCQLLCKVHHLEKTKRCGETGGGWNRHSEIPHGTVTGYGLPWKCRCELCKTAKREYRQAWAKARLTSEV